MAARRWQRACVAVSTDLAELLKRQLTGIRIQVIHNGLDEQAYVAARQAHLARPSTSGSRIAFLGRLVPVKRVDLLLDVAATLSRREPGRWHVEIVGDGPLRDSLASSAAAQGLQGTVTFHGFRADAIDVLAGCDVLAFTSDHEGTPMAALEALAVGVPVVSRRVGGMPELLEGASPSMLVDSNRPEDLADALAAVCGRRGVPAAELPGDYRITSCAAAYVRLYLELASGRA
jgi:glycosyltransferase involved in cell wall biosynthesis